MFNAYDATGLSHLGTKAPVLNDMSRSIKTGIAKHGEHNTGDTFVSFAAAAGARSMADCLKTGASGYGVTGDEGTLATELGRVSS